MVAGLESGRPTRGGGDRTRRRCATLRAMPAIAAPTLSDGVVGVRAMRDTDIPAIVAACRDPEIPRWTRVPSPYTREDAVQFLAIAATEAAAGQAIALAITGDDDRLIGTVGLMELDGTGYGEIGYWIAAEARGRGFTTRAVVLLRDWAWHALGLTTIEILAHRDNRPSQLVAERAGFVDTGEIRTFKRMPPGRQEGYKRYVWEP
jgi:RimJ/RimL family protein N-acetyltransferase